MEQQLKVQVGTQHKADLLRVLFHARIFRAFTDDLINENPNTIESIKNGTFRVLREIDVLERKILHVTDDQFPWLREKINTEKLWDIASSNDLMIRVLTEEKSEVYDELLGLLINCLNSILYMQENRKTINLTKYKKLFKLFTDEASADVHHHTGNIIFKDGDLFIRSTQ